jgi:Uma2 family endonuclease
MPKSNTLITAEQFSALPEDTLERWELVRGVVRVSEPPPGLDHCGAAAMITYRLLSVVLPARLGRVYDELGFVLARKPDTVRAPDVSFIRQERVPLYGTRGYMEGAPDLAVEVRSPSNRPKAIRSKIAHYLATGARMVWDVDPESRTVTVSRPGVPDRVLHEDDIITGEDVVPGFEHRVSDLF